MKREDSNTSLTTADKDDAEFWDLCSQIESVNMREVQRNVRSTVLFKRITDVDDWVFSAVRKEVE